MFDRENKKDESPKMKWPVDSENLRIDSLDYIYETKSINDFLNQEGKFYVCGLRGLGKTLVLQAKRKKYIEMPEKKNKSYVIIPENDQLDRLTSLGSKEEYWGFLSDNMFWKDLWTLSIGLSIISYFRNNLDRFDIKELEWKIANLPAFRAEKHQRYKNFIKFLLDWTINTRSNPSSFLTHILNFMNWNMYNSKIISDFSIGVNNVLAENIRSGCVVFLDQVDKSWEGLMSNYVSNPEKIHKLQQLQDIWYSCQIGLIFAINDICTTNHHIYVYTAIRQEVLGKLEKDSNYTRYKDKMLILNYDKDDLRNIFINSIKKFEDSTNLSKPEKISSNTIEAFIGLEQVQPFRIKTNLKENVFDYMYRHTIQRPRDLCCIGKGISEMKPEDRGEKGEGKIKELINKLSKENLITDYLIDLQRLMNINFNIVYSLIDKNVLDTEDVITICRNYNSICNKDVFCNQNCAECKKIHLFCCLYNIGLIGIINAHPHHEGRIQKFLEPDKRILLFTSPTLPKSEVYLLHTALRQEIEDKRELEGKIFHRKENLIVGDLCDYPMSCSKTDDGPSTGNKSKSIYII